MKEEKKNEVKWFRREWKRLLSIYGIYIWARGAQGTEISLIKIDSIEVKKTKQYHFNITYQMILCGGSWLHFFPINEFRWRPLITLVALHLYLFQLHNEICLYFYLLSVPSQNITILNWLVKQTKKKDSKLG